MFFSLFGLLFLFGNDVYASDVDNETHKIEKEPSPLNGSVLNIEYIDFKHKMYTITEVIK